MGSSLSFPLFISFITKKSDQFKISRKKEMASEIKIYISSSPGSLEKKKMIEKTVNVIKGQAARMNYSVETIDIADLENPSAKEFMLSNGRADARGTVSAPQIFNGTTLCGNYEDLDNAIEDDLLKEFLQLN